MLLSLQFVVLAAASCCRCCNLLSSLQFVVVLAISCFGCKFLLLFGVVAFVVVTVNC